MKNYIANEAGTWDTTTKYIRRTLVECVQKGREAYTSKNQDTKNDAYRLLGAAVRSCTFHILDEAQLISQSICLSYTPWKV